MVICSAVSGLAVFVGGGVHAETVKLCDVTVDYRLASLESGGPANAAAFQGVWAGSWDDKRSGALCSALVVELINKEGGVSAWYVNGTNLGTKSPGKQRYYGKLTDTGLVFSGGKGSVEYRNSAPGQLLGDYRAGNFSVKGTFTKQ
jgi:hypothetical protein